MKITIVGAGNVGATMADIISLKRFADELVLLDVKQGLAEGKSMDMMQAANLLNVNTRISGCTLDYKRSANSDIVVITSGVPRRPGMSREELIEVNAGIMVEAATQLLRYSPQAVLLIVANPVDTLTYLALKCSGLPPERVIGLGGILDSSRFRYYLCRALGCAASDVEGMVIGGHGDSTMLPLVRLANYGGIPVQKLLPERVIADVVQSTMNGGAALTAMIGTSAWYAPAAAGAAMVEAIAADTGQLIPSSVYLDGEYGCHDICTGVPAILGRGGVRKIVELPLTEMEQEIFYRSAEQIRSVNRLLPPISLKG